MCSSSARHSGARLCVGCTCRSVSKGACDVSAVDAGACYLYGRSFNPTVRYLGQQLAALEGMEAGYTCSSGALGAASQTWAKP